MTPEQIAVFTESLEEMLDAEYDFDHAVDMALYDARLAGLDALMGLEKAMEKYDLAQIGEALHGLVVESNHGSWDGCERPELEAFNFVFEQILFALQDKEPGAEVGGYCAGGGHWTKPHGKVQPMVYPENDPALNGE